MFGNSRAICFACNKADYSWFYRVSEYCEVVSSGGAPTPAGTSVFTKHNWDMGTGNLWLNGWGIYGPYDLMDGAFVT